MPTSAWRFQQRFDNQRIRTAGQRTVTGITNIATSQLAMNQQPTLVRLRQETAGVPSEQSYVLHNGLRPDLGRNNRGSIPRWVQI